MAGQICVLRARYQTSEPWIAAEDHKLTPTSTNEAREGSASQMVFPFPMLTHT